MRKINLNRKKSSLILALMLAGALAVTSCGSSSSGGSSSSSSKDSSSASSSSDSSSSQVTTVSGTTTLLDVDSLFTERDLTQTPDLTGATTYEVSDGEDINITSEGTYVITGTASEVTIYVEVGDEEKVQIVLDGANITNTETSVINVVSGDKVFVTTVSDSTLSVTGKFSGDESHHGTIYSECDIVFNGTATLTIQSTDNGVYTKDDLKITGGTYVVTADSCGFRANDSIVIADGDITITAGTDGLHSEHDSNPEKGYIYIGGGSITIECGDDAIHGMSLVVIDGGTINLNAYEGIEGTYIQINGGNLDIYASDDAINAGAKSDAYTPTIEFTGGTVTIETGAGDTDAVDSNGDIIISGGTIDITAQSAFDFDGDGTFTGGTVTVNGEEITELTASGLVGHAGF